MLNTKLHKKLSDRRENDTLRELKRHDSLIDFSSNDYLGFAQKKWSSNSNSASTGSRLLSGNSELHESVEKLIAQFHKTQSAILFNSGYMANLGLLSCLPQKEDTVIYDQLCHASIRDGLTLGTARNYSFKHNDVSDLEQKIKRARGTVYVIVESIYSMDGDAAPLDNISQCCKKHKAKLIVDEAHALGVFGSIGDGLAKDQDCIARIYTYGKALGGHGAAVVGSKILIDFLINFSRPLIYTTALPPHSIKRIQWGYESLKSNKERSELQQRIHLFKQHCKHPRLLNSLSAIQCIVIGGNKKTKQFASALQQHQFDVRPILHPTVAKGSERIRICLHAFNKEKDILRLCKLINKNQ